ncbi:MAG: DNA repair protein RecN [Micavibrio sp.]|nr:DNA repair protein RecN [Micavibrio sp.]
MLSHLAIDNVVLIQSLKLECKEALTVLTGETGAGKSILLDSLGLVTGSRSEARLVRKGMEKATVTASFDLPKDHQSIAILKANEIEPEDTLILKRAVGADGKSKAFINGQPAPISLLKEVGETLIEIHGQFETHGLLDPKTHRDILDGYALLQADTDILSKAWQTWKTAQKELAAIEAKIAQVGEEKNYLKDSIEDLENLNPQEGEDEALSAKKTFLLNREAILQAMQSANQAMTANAGAEDRIHQACKALEKVADKGGEKFSNFIGTLDQALNLLREVASEMESYAYDVNADGESLEEVDDRLHALKAQARKHNCFPNELPAKLEALRADLTALEKQDNDRDALIMKEQQTRKSYIAQAEKVSTARQAAAVKFEKAVNAELAPLKLEKAKIFVTAEQLGEENWSASGMDKISFTISTNPGQDPGPLNKIASGGELSRFMLAFKVVMAGTGAASTLIFDEIDAGVGGSTADAIGERLARLAKDKQILVVTHSPQVAARAAHHWFIAKAAQADGSIATSVRTLDTERKEEIARMLAGAEITEEARAAADKLLEVAKVA